MDTVANDNFFIEEPQKLRNNFFNKDKTIQMVELLAQHQSKKAKHHHIHFDDLTPSANDTRMQHLNQINDIGNNNNNINSHLSCRQLIHINSKRPHLLQQYQLVQKQLSSQQSPSEIYSRQETLSETNMPKSYIARLDLLCEATFNTDDISFAKQAVDMLVSASNSGCCFLERYITLLLNFCTKKYSISDSMKIKVDALLDKILIVDFDRQQLTENLRRPEYKLTSIEHVIQLIRRVQDMLSYEEETAISWLHVLLDAYFIELATSEEALDLIDQISAHTDFQCALVRETETTKSLLKSILEQIDNSIANSSKDNSLRHTRPYYSIENIEL